MCWTLQACLYAPRLYRCAVCARPSRATARLEPISSSYPREDSCLKPRSPATIPGGFNFEVQCPPPQVHWRPEGRWARPELGNHAMMTPDQHARNGGLLRGRAARARRPRAPQAKLHAIEGTSVPPLLPKRKRTAHFPSPAYGEARDGALATGSAAATAVVLSHRSPSSSPSARRAEVNPAGTSDSWAGTRRRIRGGCFWSR